VHSLRNILMSEDFFVESSVNICEHSCSSRHDNIAIKFFSNINITF
jgi:hypothetical protein